MFCSVVLLFIQEMFCLGSGQTNNSECYSDVNSISTSQGNNMNLVCEPERFPYIFCATILENGVYQVNSPTNLSKTELVQSRCLLKPNCTIAVDSQSLSIEHFNDKPVSLNVIYECKKVFYSSTNEQHFSTLTCDNGSLVDVYSAMYGPVVKISSCYTHDRTSAIKRMCDGLPVCSFRVDNKKFGPDPCWSRAKHLTLNYGCKSDCSIDINREKCSNPCNNNCKNGSCYFESGVCNLGCEYGFTGDRCDGKCPFKTYGHNCSQQCSEFCGGFDQECDHVNGTCLDACQAGYTGLNCDLKCPLKTYGENCSLQCSEFCGGQECHHVNGTCLSGCRVGYTGPVCDSKLGVKNTVHYSSSAIFASILFVLVVLTICLLPKTINTDTWASMEVFEDRGLGTPTLSKLDLEPRWSNFDNIDPLPEIDEPPEQL